MSSAVTILETTLLLTALHHTSGPRDCCPLKLNREAVGWGTLVARASKKWEKARISPLDIVLDRDNPRINVEAGDKESDIIRKLIRYEDVQDLARKIAVSGLLPGERVIVARKRPMGRSRRRSPNLRLQAAA